MSPRSPAQYEKIRQKSREKITKTALKLFAYDGYHNTSIEKIASRAKISKGLIYNYFPSKEKLLEAAIFETVEGMVHSFDFLFEDIPPRQKLEKCVGLFFQMIVSDIDFWKLYWSMIMNPGIPRKFIGRIQKMHEPFEEVLTKIFRELKIKNPAAESRLLMATFDGLSLYHHQTLDEKYLNTLQKALINRYIGKL